MIVVVAALKGGVGKTTTAVYLAAVASANRRAVTIVDADQLGGTMMEQLASLFDEEDTKAVRAARGQRANPKAGKTGAGKSGRRAA
jgi:cellulose biosynthesis protein BcsQ